MKSGLVLEASGAVVLVALSGAVARGQSGTPATEPLTTSAPSLSAGVGSLRHDSNRSVYQNGQPEGDSAALKEPKIWEFINTPYFYAAGMKGNVTLDGSTTPLDLSFSDVIDSFDVIGFSTIFEAWHKPSRWGFASDINYIGLDGDFSTSTPGTSLNVKMDQLIVKAAAGYRLVEPEPGEPGAMALGNKLSIDVFGGLRYLYLNQDLSLSTGGSSSDNDSWFQPFVGQRIHYSFNDKTTFMLSGDIGYWEDGGNRSTIWNVLVGIDWKPWSNVSLKGGYHWQDVNAQSDSGGGFGENLAFSGPMIGLSIYW